MADKVAKISHLFLNNLLEFTNDTQEANLGMLFFGSSLSFANPPNRYTLFPNSVKLCPGTGKYGESNFIKFNNYIPSVCNSVVATACFPLFNNAVFQN